MSNDENAIHFGAIRQAFANNNAAVMVGSGFSRNADGGDSLATWPDVAKALWTSLSEILCVRHTIPPKEFHAPQDDEARYQRQIGTAANFSQAT